VGKARTAVVAGRGGPKGGGAVRGVVVDGGGRYQAGGKSPDRRLREAGGARRCRWARAALLRGRRARPGSLETAAPRVGWEASQPAGKPRGKLGGGKSPDSRPHDRRLPSSGGHRRRLTRTSRCLCSLFSGREAVTLLRGFCSR
jgi:hypothetical protein